MAEDLSRSTVAVVTPTLNRRALVARLYAHLLDQTDHNFVWVVVDDGGRDGTAPWVASVARQAPFPILIVRNPQTVGKCASLNRSFDAVEADLYLIVDSDDYLLNDAIVTVKKRLSQHAGDRRLGALFFSYRSPDGVSLGGPPSGVELRCSRAIMDQHHGKYDGCTGYLRSLVAKHRYPQFPGETYLGPTVLQYQMDPGYDMIFCPETVGVAEYRDDGLSRAGRALRLANPQGMMLYSALRARSSDRVRLRAKHRIAYWAYRIVLDGGSAPPEEDLPQLERSHVWERWLGGILLRWWRRRLSRGRTQ